MRLLRQRSRIDNRKIQFQQISQFKEGEKKKELLHNSIFEWKKN